MRFRPPVARLRGIRAFEGPQEGAVGDMAEADGAIIVAEATTTGPRVSQRPRGRAHQAGPSQTATSWAQAPLFGVLSWLGSRCGSIIVPPHVRSLSEETYPWGHPPLSALPQHDVLTLDIRQTRRRTQSLIWTWFLLSCSTSAGRQCCLQVTLSRALLPLRAEDRIPSLLGRLLKLPFDHHGDEQERTGRGNTGVHDRVGRHIQAPRAAARGAADGRPAALPSPAAAWLDADRQPAGDFCSASEGRPQGD